VHLLLANNNEAYEAAKNIPGEQLHQINP